MSKRGLRLNKLERALSPPSQPLFRIFLTDAERINFIEEYRREHGREPDMSSVEIRFDLSGGAER